MKTLISMTDFVLESISKFNTYELEENLSSIIKYANFLKQPLNLGMFVPCDEEGNVYAYEYEEPIQEDYWSENGTVYSGELFKHDLNRYMKYKKAKEKVLFEGFYYQSNFSEKQNKLYEYIRNKHPHVFSFEQINNSTVESLLTGYKKEFLITLTESAIKQIGL